MAPVKQYIKLRGHHLVCLHFFRGAGYNYEFVANLREILERAWFGEEIEICPGADDVCKKCPHLKGKMCYFDGNANNEIRKMDRKAIKLLRLSAQGKLLWAEIRRRIPEIIEEWTDLYCKTCGWRKACEKDFPDR